MMTTAKEYTIPELTYEGSKHSGKVLVDRADYYASMAREAALQKRLDFADELIREAWRLMDGQEAKTAEWHFAASNYINHPLKLVDTVKPKLQPWVCALCDQQHMDGEVCVEEMARNGVEQ